MDNFLQIFREYIHSNYDMSNELICEKYNHSIRVAILMQMLSNKLKLTDEEYQIAFLIGLVHDLGRFREVERSQKFNNLSFDHGAYSNKIMFNDGLIESFKVNPRYYLIIRKALYFHNKKDLTGPMTEEEELFAKMIRDADKLDILYIRSLKKHLLLDSEPTEKVKEDFLHDRSIDLHDMKLKGKADSILLYLSFIKDLYFDESYELAVILGFLHDILNIIDVKEGYEDLYRELIAKVEERGKKDARIKVRSLESRGK